MSTSKSFRTSFRLIQTKLDSLRMDTTALREGPERDRFEAVTEILDELTKEIWMVKHLIDSGWRGDD